MADPSKKQAATARKPPNAGKGRPKGSVNKITSDVKEMVLSALAQAGGVSYLYEQARENPKAFLSLVGRIIPTQIQGDPDNPLQAVVNYVANIPKR